MVVQGLAFAAATREWPQDSLSLINKKGEVLVLRCVFLVISRGILDETILLKVKVSFLLLQSCLQCHQELFLLLFVLIAKKDFIGSTTAGRVFIEMDSL